jgi:hypothetical protein
MKSCGGSFGACPECGIEHDIGSPAVRPIVECSVLDYHVEHLFEADRLRAELNTVRIVGFWSSPFVFDGHHTRASAANPSVKFDHVSLATKAEAKGAQCEATRDAQSVPRLPRPRIGALVEVSPFYGESVLRPEPLDVNERALPLTEDEMLERRKREKLILGEHESTC